MTVPKRILFLADKLCEKVQKDVPFTQSDFTTLAELQAWYRDYLDDLEPVTYKWNLPDDVVEDIVRRMDR